MLDQCWILNPQSEARNWTHFLMDTSQICFHCASSWMLVRFVSAEPWWGLPYSAFKSKRNSLDFFCFVLFFINRLNHHATRYWKHQFKDLANLRKVMLSSGQSLNNFKRIDKRLVSNGKYSHNLVCSCQSDLIYYYFFFFYYSNEFITSVVV